MDQEIAKKRFQEGAFFIFLNVPEGTEFGIDMKSWNTGEKFRGVKMIPPGLHFIFFSSVDEMCGDRTSPRVGFFHNFKLGEVLVKKWDKQLETMCSEDVPESEIVGLRENITTLDAFMGPYPYDILDKWKSLTNVLSENLVKKLCPDSGIVSSVLELQSMTDAERPRGRKGENNGESSSKKIKLLPNLKPVEGTELRLTKVPERRFPEGAQPSEITLHSLDSTYVLEVLLKSYENQRDIVGEIQFCFICFLVGHSLEAFEQWKKLLTVLCNISVGLKKYQDLYKLLIPTLKVQVKEIPEEFLADIVANNNVVYTNLRNLFRNTLNSEVISDDLKCQITRFAKELKDLYHWDFSNLDEDEEDEAPVVVEI